MKLLKADQNTKSAVEYAALEATNNRLAVKELRSTIRLTIRALKALNTSGMLGGEAVYYANFILYLEEKLRMTTRSKLRGW